MSVGWRTTTIKRRSGVANVVGGGSGGGLCGRSDGYICSLFRCVFVFRGALFTTGYRGHKYARRDRATRVSFSAALRATLRTYASVACPVRNEYFPRHFYIRNNLRGRARHPQHGAHRAVDRASNDNELIADLRSTCVPPVSHRNFF